MEEESNTQVLEDEMEETDHYDWRFFEQQGWDQVPADLVPNEQPHFAQIEKPELEHSSYLCWPDDLENEELFYGDPSSPCLPLQDELEGDAPDEEARGSSEVAASRKSRSRHWPSRSTEYPRFSSLFEYREQALEVSIGRGMNAGRNLMAIFDDQDETSRTRYKLKVERGRPLKHWPYAPSSDIALPVGLTLSQICHYYSSHVWGTGLRLFMAEGWTGEEIWLALPEDARNDKAQQRKWNYLQQAMGREADRMYEEDNNPKRIPVKRSRADSNVTLASNTEDPSVMPSPSQAHKRVRLVETLAEAEPEVEITTRLKSEPFDIDFAQYHMQNQKPVPYEEYYCNQHFVAQIPAEAAETTTIPVCGVATPGFPRVTNDFALHDLSPTELKQQPVLLHPPATTSREGDAQLLPSTFDLFSHLNPYALQTFGPDRTTTSTAGHQMSSDGQISSHSNTRFHFASPSNMSPTQDPIRDRAAALASGPRSTTLPPTSILSSRIRQDAGISETLTEDPYSYLLSMTIPQLSEHCKGLERQQTQGIAHLISKRSPQFVRCSIDQQRELVKQARDNYYVHTAENLLLRNSVDRTMVNRGKPFSMLHICVHLEKQRLFEQNKDPGSFPIEELHRRAWVLYTKLMEAIAGKINEDVNVPDKVQHQGPENAGTKQALDTAAAQTTVTEGQKPPKSAPRLQHDEVHSASIDTPENISKTLDRQIPSASDTNLGSPATINEPAKESTLTTSVQNANQIANLGPQTREADHFIRCPSGDALSVKQAKSLSYEDIVRKHPNALNRPQIAALFVDPRLVHSETSSNQGIAKYGLGAAFQHLSRHENDFWSPGELEKKKSEHFAREDMPLDFLHVSWDRESAKVGMIYEPLSEWYENCINEGLRWLKSSKQISEKESIDASAPKKYRRPPRGMKRKQSEKEASDAPEISEAHRMELKRRETDWNKFDQKTRDALRRDFTPTDIAYFRHQWSGMVEGLENYSDDQVIALATGKTVTAAVDKNSKMIRKNTKDNKE